MRILAWATLAALTFAAGPAQAQAPQGSYRRTCVDVRFQPPYLTARCADKGGRAHILGIPIKLEPVFVRTSLNVVSCRAGVDIYNDDGTLRCIEAVASPPGTYKRTCRDILMRGQVLSARCKKLNGLSMVSQLNLAGCYNYRTIANRNGVLRCE